MPPGLVAIILRVLIAGANTYYTVAAQHPMHLQVGKQPQRAFGANSEVFNVVKFAKIPGRSGIQGSKSADNL